MIFNSQILLYKLQQRTCRTCNFQVPHPVTILNCHLHLNKIPDLSFHQIEEEECPLEEDDFSINKVTDHRSKTMAIDSGTINKNSMAIINQMRFKTGVDPVIMAIGSKIQKEFDTETTDIHNFVHFRFILFYGFCLMSCLETGKMIKIDLFINVPIFSLQTIFVRINYFLQSYWSFFACSFKLVYWPKYLISFISSLFLFIFKFLIILLSDEFLQFKPAF